MSGRKSYPHWAYSTHRLFKSAKRAEIKRLAKALDDVRIGCAYLPDGRRLVEEISVRVKELQQRTSVKAWGR